MSCSIDKETINNIISFHRHSCPGLAIGIRAAEYALQKFPATSPSNLVCITETDMCGVDAIQFLTGCSFGKGNLIHKDYGKSAFSFYDRTKTTGYRFLFTPEYPQEFIDEEAELALQRQTDPTSKKVKELNIALRDKKQRWIMDIDLAKLYSVKEISVPPPRPAQILQSLTCEACGELTMESRIRQYGGKTLCIPCFEKVEQKI